jgi:hypothetical protein
MALTLSISAMNEDTPRLTLSAAPMRTNSLSWTYVRDSGDMVKVLFGTGCWHVKMGRAPQHLVTV